MAIYTFVIDNWIPHRLNALTRKTRAERIRYGKLDRDMIGAYFLAAGIPRAECKRRVSACFTFWEGSRRPDVDAYFKSVLDALVACGALVDDSPRWCKLGDWDFVYAEGLSTSITLEDIEP